MNCAVRYFSKSGNTKKVAEAVAQAIGVEAKDVSFDLEEKVDILFLGNAMYAAGIAEEVKTFISKNKDKIGEVVNISTTAIAKSTMKAVKKVCDANGVNVNSEEYSCRGAFAVMHKNRPNEDDIKNAVAFAKIIIK